MHAAGRVVLREVGICLEAPKLFTGAERLDTLTPNLTRLDTLNKGYFLILAGKSKNVWVHNNTSHMHDLQ